MPTGNVISIKTLTNESVRKEIDNSSSSSSYILADLAGCDVICLGVSSNASVEACSYCNILIAPCESKIRIKDCTDCVFTVATTALEVDNCSNCTFYVFAHNVTTVSFSANLRFAPFNGAYYQFPTMFDAAGFKTSENKWENIKTADEESSYCKLQSTRPISLLTPGTAEFSEFTKEKLRQVFRRFDLDHDQLWSIGEFNSFLKELGSDQRVTHSTHLQRLFADIGLDLGDRGALTLNDVLTLYTVQGIEEVKSDLATLSVSLDELSQWNVDLKAIPLLQEVLSPVNPVDSNSVNALHEPRDSVQAAIDARMKRYHKSTDSKTPDNNTITTEPTEVDTKTVEGSSRNATTTSLQHPEMQNLINSAVERGVDVALWFQYFDKSDSGKLSADAFERALTGVGLGMGFGMGQNAQAPIEKALEPDHLAAVVLEFTDTDDENVDYRRFLQSAGVLKAPESSSTPAPKQQQPVATKKVSSKVPSVPKIAKKPKKQAVAAAPVLKPSVPKFSKKRFKKKKSSVVGIAAVTVPENDLLPGHLSLAEIESRLQALFKHSPEKYMSVWRSLQLHVEDLSEDLITSENEFQAALHRIGFSLDARQAHNFSGFVSNKPWLGANDQNDAIIRRHNAQSSSLSSSLSLSNALSESSAEQLLSGTTFPETSLEDQILADAAAPNEGAFVEIKRTDLRDYLRHLKLHHLQSHSDWRRSKVEMKKKDTERRRELFLKSIQGKKHDLTEKEIKTFITSSFSFEVSALTSEATREATAWIDLQEGRAVVFKEVRKNEQASVSRKQIENKVRHSVLEKRINFLLTNSGELSNLKFKLYMAYNRECVAANHCSCPDFTDWLRRRTSSFKEQQRLLAEWNRNKIHQRAQAERWAKDVAPTHEVHRTLTQLIHASPRQGVKVNKSLLKLSRQSKQKNTHSSNNKQQQQSWWDRLSTHRELSLDGTGGVVSRGACLDAVSEIVPSLPPRESKSVFKDPEDVRASLNRRLESPAGQVELDKVVQYLKSTGKTTLSSSELSNEAREILLNKELRGQLFTYDSEKVEKEASEELQAHLVDVKEQVSKWNAKKEKCINDARLARAEEKRLKAEKMKDRQKSALTAYERWEASSKKKKYFSYKENKVVKRPQVKVEREREEQWVDILQQNPSSSSSMQEPNEKYYAKQLEQMIKEVSAVSCS